MFPAGADGDFTGIDNLFGFARVAGLKVIYTLRMLNRSTKPIRDLETVDAQVAGHIWSNYRDNVASFAIGNEPDWHDFHSYAGRPADPAIYEEISGVPGSAYSSYRARWQAWPPGHRRRARGAVVRTGRGGLRPADMDPQPRHWRVVD